MSILTDAGLPNPTAESSLLTLNDQKERIVNLQITKKFDSSKILVEKSVEHRRKKDKALVKLFNSLSLSTHPVASNML